MVAIPNCDSITNDTGAFVHFQIMMKLAPITIDFCYAGYYDEIKMVCLLQTPNYYIIHTALNICRLQ